MLIAPEVRVVVGVEVSEAEENVPVEMSAIVTVGVAVTPGVVTPVIVATP